VLDIATGTGRNFPHFMPTATVTAFDLSPAMLSLARQRAIDLGRDIELKLGDAEHLPFADDSFDTAVCVLSLCTIPDPVAAIGEMRRVLIPGGRLLLIDHIGSSWPPIFAGQWLLEQVTIRAVGEHFTRRPLASVESAGFEIVEVERLRAGTIERVHARKPER
jgi:ubiquinone/menaquinone biosynthesis C-methylase UbiE